MHEKPDFRFKLPASVEQAGGKRRVARLERPGFRTSSNAAV